MSVRTRRIRPAITKILNIFLFFIYLFMHLSVFIYSFSFLNSCETNKKWHIKMVFITKQIILADKQEMEECWIWKVEIYFCCTFPALITKDVKFSSFISVSAALC